MNTQRKKLLPLLTFIFLFMLLAFVPNKVYAGSDNDFVVENGILTEYTGTDNSITIPDTVTEISADAFEGCSTLIDITIPDCVNKIGKNAFTDCSNLLKIHCNQNSYAESYAMQSKIAVCDIGETTVRVSSTGIKKQCKELTDWCGYQLCYKFKKGESKTYSMSKADKQTLLSFSSGYSSKKDTKNWDKTSLRLFGQKTSDIVEPLVGDWGTTHPELKNIKVKKHKTNQYKVTETLYFYSDLGDPRKKRGTMTVFLKRTNNSSYGTGITKIKLKAVK